MAKYQDLYLTDNFISRAKGIHKDKPYDYSKVSCTKFSDYVTIICDIHGEFRQQAYAHISGRGCPNCRHCLDQEEYKQYLLSEFNLKLISPYRGQRKDIVVECSKHGYIIDIAENVQHGGCTRCKYPYRLIEDFMELAKQVHGDKYSYIDLKEPLLCKQKINVVCNTCNTNFTPTITNHINHKSGCPNCWKTNARL